MPAAEGIDPDELPEGWDDWQFIPYVEARYSAEADAGETGELAIGRGQLGMRVEKIPALFLHLGFNAEVAIHDYSGSYAGSDFDRDTRSGALAFTPTVRFHENWSVFAPLSIQAGWEEDGPRNENSSLQWGLGVQYHNSLSQRIGIGTVVQERLEDDDVVLPFVTADWRFNERWRLIVLDPVDGISRLLYFPSTRWSYGLRASTELAQFRLANDTVLEDDHVAVALSAGHRTETGPDVSAFLGLVAWREITLRDERGEVVEQETLDPALHLGIDARWRF